MKLSEQIKKSRSEQKITLKNLSEKTGFSMMYLSEIERGIKRPIKKDTLMKISEALNIEYHILIDGLLETISEEMVI